MLILYKYAQTALIMFKFLLNALIFPSFPPPWADCISKNCGNP